MAANEEMSKMLRNARILYIAFLGAVLIDIIILVILPYIGLSIFARDDPFLTPVAAALGGVAVISFAIGVYVPRRMTRKSRKPQDLLRFHLVRGTFFHSLAHAGLILGILGTGWYVTVPFFIVAALALILTFPTEEKWKQMLE